MIKDKGTRESDYFGFVMMNIEFKYCFRLLSQDFFSEVIYYKKYETNKIENQTLNCIELGLQLLLERDISFNKIKMHSDIKLDSKQN